MARFDDLYERFRKKRKENGTGYSGAGDFTSGDATDFSTYTGSGRFAGILEKARKNGISFSGVDENYIQSFMQDAQSFVKKSQQESQSLTWAGATSQEQYDNRVKTMQDLGSRADAVRVYLNANKGKIKPEWYDYLSGFLRDFDSDTQSIFETFHGAKGYYSQWDSQEAYDFYDAHSTPEKRQQWYAGLEAQREKLEAEKEKETAAWQKIGEEIENPYEYWEKEEVYNSKIKSIQEQIDKIDTEMRQYERSGYNERGQHYGSKVADDALALSKEKDFATLSQKRDHKNPTREELDLLDSMNNSANWDYDETGTYWDAYGNKIVTGEDGKMVSSKAKDYAIQDRLGLFLSATETDMEEYMGTIVNGTWGAILGEGIEGSWDQLNENEIGVYYYLLNKDGQAAAEQYLKEMKPELNRRTAEAKAISNAQRYNEAGLVGKLLLNTATVPANLMGGIAGLAENTAHLIRGEEVNPYSSAHSMTRFSNTIREETAKELDELMPGAKLPVLDFTVGDLYQTVMSRVDSLAAMGIGGKLGGVLLATGAAENEMTRLYEQGASLKQMLWGATAVGAAELVFESLSIEKLINMKDAKTAGQWIKNVLIQGGIEASEEGFTEIANILSNAAIMGSQSDWNKLVADNNGDKKAAFLEKVRDVARAGFGGFLSGTMGGAAMTRDGKTREDIKEDIDRMTPMDAEWALETQPETRVEDGEGVRQAQEQAQEQPGEAVGTEDYEGEEDYEETVEDRLEIRKRRLQYEVRQNQAHREEVTQRLEAEIAALREEYDGLQNKNTKKANQLLRRIDNKTGQLTQRQAEYDKTIRGLQERIAKVEEKLQQDHTKEDRLEKTYRKIDEEYQQAELELATEYYKNRYPLATELENREKWLSDMAFDLYWQMNMHKKGDKLSNRLKAMVRTGKDWQEIKYALEDIKDSPEAISQNPTDTELLVREILEKDYETKRGELTAMEEDFNRKLTELQKEKEARKKKATVAGKRKESRSKYLYEVAKVAGDISGWKDLPTGLHYKTQTLQRYLGDVVRTPEGKQDLEKAKALYEYTQGSYNHMEAEMKRELNEKFNKIAALKINPQESTYIQLLGEYRQGGKDTAKTAVTKTMVESYYAEHADKIDTEKVEKALEIARADYDDVFARANEVLREHGMEELKYVLGYFPHMKPIHQTWWQKALNVQPKEEKTRSTAVAGKTGAFRPNKKQQGFSKERSGPETEYDFLRGYEQYMTGVLDWIYHIPDIQRMKALENYIRITSAQKDEVLAKKIKEIQESDAYNADEEQLQLDLIFQSDTKNDLPNIVIDLMNRTNNLAGKRTGGDRTVEELLNPDAAKVLQQISGRNDANLVAGSISAAFSNFLALTRAIGGTSLRGMGSAIWDYTFHNKEVDAVDKSDFLTNRLRNPDKLQKGFWDKTSDVIGWLGEWTDGLTSRVIWDARYKDNVKMGMSAEAAIKDADEFAESVLGGRSRGNKPTLFNSNNIVAKVFTTCQLEVANDYGFLFKDLPRDQRIGKTNRLAAAYTKIAIGTFLLTELFYEPLTGRSPGFDPLGMVLDLIFGLADDEEEPKDAVLDFLEEGLQNVPFIGGLLGGGRVPLSSAMPYDSIQGAVKGLTKDVASGDGKSVWEEMTNPLYYLVSPMGGGQLRKTLQGSIGLYAGKEHPGSYTYDENGEPQLRFPVEEGIAPWLQAALFGKWSGQNAQQYLEEGRKPLSAKQTREFFESGMTIQEYWDYRDEMTKLKKQDEKLALINGMDITEDQKRVLKRYLFDEEKYAEENPEKYAFLEEEGIGYLGWKELPDDAKDAWDWAFENQDKAVMGDVFSRGVVEYRKYTKAMSELKADKDADGKTVAGSRKQKVTDYINGLDIDYGEKIILYVAEFNSTASRDMYGSEIVEYLNGRNDLSEKQIREILKQLGFEVAEDGRVTWE